MRVYMVLCSAPTDPVHAAFSTMVLAQEYLENMDPEYCKHDKWIFWCEVDAEV